MPKSLWVTRPNFYWPSSSQDISGIHIFSPHTELPSNHKLLLCGCTEKIRFSKTEQCNIWYLKLSSQYPSYFQYCIESDYSKFTSRVINFFFRISGTMHIWTLAFDCFLCQTFEILDNWCFDNVVYMYFVMFLMLSNIYCNS